MPLTFQTIRSLFSVKPVTTDVARSQALIFLKPNAKLDAKDSIPHTAAKLEQFGGNQKECAQAVRTQLSTSEKWLATVKQSKPDAIVHARVVKSKDKTGTSERSTIVLYTKSKASNWASELFDHFFYSKDRALAANVLLALESHFPQSGNNIQSAGSPMQSSKQGPETRSGISAKDFAARLTNYRQAAAAAEAKAAVDSDLFAPFSWIRVDIQFAIFPGASKQQPSEIQRTKDQLEQAKAKLDKDFMHSGSSSAFEKFVDSIKSGTSPQGIDKGLILDYCDKWKRYGNENLEFQAFLDSTPVLKKWNIIALIIADRDRHFSAKANANTQHHEFSSTDEFFKLVDDFKSKNASSTEPNDDARKPDPVEEIETGINRAKETGERHIDEKGTIGGQALDYLGSEADELVKNIESVFSHVIKEVEETPQKVKSAIDDAMEVQKSVGTNLQDALNGLSYQRAAVQEKLQGTINDLSTQGVAFQEKAKAAFHELNNEGAAARKQAEEAFENIANEGMAAAKNLTTELGATLQKFLGNNQAAADHGNDRDDAASRQISADDGNRDFPAAEPYIFGSDENDASKSPKKGRKKRKIPIREISDPVPRNGVK